MRHFLLLLLLLLSHNEVGSCREKEEEEKREWGCSVPPSSSPSPPTVGVGDKLIRDSLLGSFPLPKKKMRGWPERLPHLEMAVGATV